MKNQIDHDRLLHEISITRVLNAAITHLTQLHNNAEAISKDEEIAKQQILYNIEDLEEIKATIELCWENERKNAQKRYAEANPNARILGPKPMENDR